jgi:hypothetical protein
MIIIKRMENKLIPFEKIMFIETQDKKYNVPHISEKEKKLFYNNLEKKGFYNGCLASVANYSIKDNFLKISLGKTNFFDLILAKDINKKVFPVLAVNAVLEIEDYIVFIKRGEEVYSYNNRMDFPAGLVSYNESIFDRLKNRINVDTKINEDKIAIGKIIPCAIIQDGYSFNLFFRVKYKGTKEELENFFSENFKFNKPLLVKKGEISSFFKEKNKPVFFEVLDFI